MCRLIIRTLILPAMLAAIFGCQAPLADRSAVVVGGRTSLDNLNATLWIQRSAEADATIRQSFRLAMDRLDESLQDEHWDALVDVRPPGHTPPANRYAVIVDIDETILDNAAYRAWLVVNQREYCSASWSEWVADEAAPLLPGVDEFFAHVKRRNDELSSRGRNDELSSRGRIAVFFITNRLHTEEDSTRSNLHQFGLLDLEPEDEDTVLSKWDRNHPDVGTPVTRLERQHRWDSSKSARRLHVAENYRVLLLIGDDFNDFVDAYRLSLPERDRRYAEDAHRFGRQWIMIPNPTYGSWEFASFDYGFDLPAAEKRERKMQRLKSWR